MTSSPGRDGRACRGSRRRCRRRSSRPRARRGSRTGARRRGERPPRRPSAPGFGRFQKRPRRDREEHGDGRRDPDASFRGRGAASPAAPRAPARTASSGSTPPTARTRRPWPTGTGSPGPSPGSAARCGRARAETLRPECVSSGGSSLQDRGDRVARRVALERLPAREQLVQDRAEGEEVACGGRRAGREPARATCSPSCP